MTAATLRPAAPESEPIVTPMSSEPLPLDSDAPSALLREPHESAEVQGASDPPATPSDTHTIQPDTEGDDSLAQPDSSQFSHLAPAKLRQLLSWLAAKHQPSQLTDHISQAPHVISSAPRQHVESAHTELAESESTQLQDGESAHLQGDESAQLKEVESAPDAHAESAQTESEGAESYRSDARTHRPQLPDAVLPGLQFFLLSAASLLLAWFVSSLLIRSFTSPSTRLTTLEAQIPHEEEEQEEEASPEAAHPASEAAEEEEEQQQSEQGMGLVTRARSVARSMSEAVSGMVTNRSEAHEAEEAGLEAESAPGGSGAGTSRRGARPRGRRELAALGNCPQPCAAASHHVLLVACAVADCTAGVHIVSLSVPVSIVHATTCQILL